MSSLPEKIPSSTLDKLANLLRSISDQQIHFIITYNGLFDEKKLQKAMRLLFDIEPILGCKFIEQEKNPYWIRRNNINDLDYFILEKTTNTRQSILNFINLPANPSRDPLVRIKLIRDKVDILCLKVSHVVMDGAGMIQYLIKLSELYEQLDNKSPQELRKVTHISERLDFRDVINTLNFFTKIFKFITLKGPKPTWAFPWKDTKQGEKDFAIRKLTPKQLEGIKKYGKKRNATINDLLLTAFYRSVFSIIKPSENKPMTAVCTVNLRSYLPESKQNTIGNLSSAFYLTIPFNQLDDFDDVLEKIKSITKKAKNSHPGISAAMLQNIFFKVPYQKAKDAYKKRIQRDLESKTTHPVFTNVGRIPLNILSFDSLTPIDGYMITPAIIAPGFLVGAITFGQNLSICIGFNKGSYDENLIKTFMDYFKKELITIAKIEKDEIRND